VSEWYGCMSHSTDSRSFQTSLFRQSIALVLTTKNKETKHYIHLKHKRQTGIKPALTNKTN